MAIFSSSVRRLAAATRSWREGAVPLQRLAASRVWGRSTSASTTAGSTSSLDLAVEQNGEPSQDVSSELERIYRLREQVLSPGFVKKHYYKTPLVVKEGKGQWLYDHHGNRYLDCFGCAATNLAGHCHPKVVAAAKEQLSQIWTTVVYTHKSVYDYAEKLVARLPGKLKVVYFTNSGSEANDLALLMARLYTGAFDIVSLRNSFHGGSPYVLGLTGISAFKFPFPCSFGMQQVDCPDVFRGPWGGANCRDSLGQTPRNCDCSEGQCVAADKYAQHARETIVGSCPGKMAAFIYEPLQGSAGVVQPPRTYFKQMFEVVRERGGLCISDEVQSGFGRLGTHFWGFEAHGVVPDIVTMAKGMGNGIPMGAVITTPEVAETMGRAVHFNTFGGNPVACAIGSAVLDVIDEDRLQENSRKVGEVFMKELIKLREEFEVVGDVRGKGLMIGVEMVKNKSTKEPLPVGDLLEKFKDHGVLVGKGANGSSFRFSPPLCFTEEDVAFAVGAFRKVLLERN